MKQIPQDKYSVAWFTLAECVSRGEKVRALGVYRLLSHSIDDHAFRRQLEGDILLAFKDEDAINKYYESACLYQKTGRLLEAAAVYEHIVSLVPDSRTYTAILVNLYRQMNLSRKASTHARTLFALMLQNDDLPSAREVLQELEQLDSLPQVAALHQQYVYALLRSKDQVRAVVLFHIKKAIEGFFQVEDNKALQRFVAALEALEPSYHEQACLFMAQGKAKA